MSTTSRFHPRAAVFAVAALVLFLAPTGRAQVPDTFENLKVLPKDIAKNDLVETMRGFSFSLGVRCEHCHAPQKDAVAGDGSLRLDFASDERPAKRTAREMMKMVADLNGRYLTKLEPKATLSVGCYTCHRGTARPEALDAMVRRIAADSGLTVALARYEALREAEYGGGSYDFSQTALNRVAESFLDRDRPGDAVAALELNARYNRPGGWMLMLLGQAYAADGQRDKARETYEKALEMQPDNPRIKRALEALDRGEGPQN